MEKYSLNYSLKKPDQSTLNFHSQKFKTKKDLNLFLKRNKDLFFWHQIINHNAKSKESKMILNVSDDQELNDFLKTNNLFESFHEGVLDTYFETGFEQLLIHLYDGPDLERREYKYMRIITESVILEINSIKYFLNRDMQLAKEDGYRLSFYPQGFTSKEWRTLFDGRTRAKMWILKKNN